MIASPPLGWSPLWAFLGVWSPSGDMRDPSVVFELVDVPCTGPLNLSHIADYIYDLCPLPDPDVDCLCLYVMLSFSLWSRLPQVYHVHACWVSMSLHHNTNYDILSASVHLSLQADGNVSFDDITVFAFHDSSLYLFVMIIFLDAVALSQVSFTFNVFYQHKLFTFIGVLSVAVSFVFAMFISMPICLLP